MSEDFKDLEDLEEINYNKIQKEINEIIKSKELREIELEDLEIGKIIYIVFIPYSQKYIYNLVPKLGKIEELPEDLINEILLINIKNYKGINEGLFHEGVSYYGDNLGYDYKIYEII